MSGRFRRSPRSTKPIPNQVGAWERWAQDHESKGRDLHAKIGELIVERDFLTEDSRGPDVGVADRPQFGGAKRAQVLPEIIRLARNGAWNAHPARASIYVTSSLKVLNCKQSSATRFSSNS